MKTKSLVLLSLLVSLAGVSVARAENLIPPPTVPPGLQVPDGHKVSFHTYASGVQIYIGTRSPADPTKLVWTFAGPQAIMQDAAGALAGHHYAHAGPTRPGWANENGSLVVAMRNVPAVTVNSSAIPWLLLEAIDTDGPAPFKKTTYIQRVNTTGGRAPATPPMVAGQEARVPYTAEYYFYRKSN